MYASRPRLLALALVVSTAALGLLPAGPAAGQDRARRIVLTPETDYWYRGFTAPEVSASDVAPGCPGLVPTVPDLIVEVDSGIWAHLRVDTDGDSDATLVVRSSGTNLCNDDADALTRDPELITYLAPGEYGVYVGVKTPGARSRYRLRVAEASEQAFPTVRRERPLRLQGISGGAFDASQRDPVCLGAIAGRPNHVVRLRQPEAVYITASSSSDLTLVVVGPDGTVHCNDDARQSLNPRVVEHFSEGLIRIYVGSHNPSVNAHYTLDVGLATSG
jgi:hypothetical protein